MRNILSNLFIILIAVVCVLFVRNFVVMPISIDGPSMEPTLSDGDYVLMERVSYLRNNPERFDIIVFKATEDKDYIKRIIGLPGEDIRYEESELFVNGEPVIDPVLNMETTPYLLSFDLESITGDKKLIPDDYYLVLGDNRNNSTDSRTLGLIHRDQVIGRATLRYWPIDSFGWVR